MYASCRCQWIPHLPHLGKCQGSYACSNLGCPGSHSQAIAVPGCCLGIASHSNCHISQLTPPIDVILSILESTHPKLHIAHGLTNVPPSVRGWEAFPMLRASPTLGSLGPSHQWRHKSWVSLRGPPCAHDVLSTPHGEVRDCQYDEYFSNLGNDRQNLEHNLHMWNVKVDGNYMCSFTNVSMSYLHLPSKNYKYDKLNKRHILGIFFQYKQNQDQTQNILSHSRQQATRKIGLFYLYHFWNTKFSSSIFHLNYSRQRQSN